MRTVSAVTLALLALAPVAASAAGDPYSAIEQMRTAFARVQSVQLVERFPNGAVATVQFTPSLGHKSLYGMMVDGYRLMDQSGAIETVWINAHALPVSMHVEAFGESMDVLYGDYDNPTYFATKP